MERVIVLSAHCDDAALSLGGYIFDLNKMGMKTEVWTFFCRLPEGKKEREIMRREEDKKAMKVLGASWVHYTFYDAQERLNRAGDKMYGNVFANPHPDDRACNEIAMMLERDTRPGDKVFVPLAIGGHVDHTILRQAAEMLHIPLIYYPDFPYADYVPEKIPEAIVGLTRFQQQVTYEALDAWQDAMREYISQNLYTTPDITAQKIHDYWATINGIWLYERKT